MYPKTIMGWMVFLDSQERKHMPKTAHKEWWEMYKKERKKKEALFEKVYGRPYKEYAPKSIETMSDEWKAKRKEVKR